MPPAAATLAAVTALLLRCARAQGAPPPADSTVITTVAGGANASSLGFLAGVAPDRASSSLYTTDASSHRVWLLNSDTGLAVAVAGTGAAGFSGDGGPATSASLASPWGVAVDAAGNVLIADRYNNRIRRLVVGTRVMTTVAGNGARGFSGDRGPGTSASLASPWGVAVDAAGNVFIADTWNRRIRRLAAGTGLITTVAGAGGGSFSGDGGPGTSAGLSSPTGVVVDATGNVFIADGGDSRIRRLAAGTGVITTVAGNGVGGFGGDGGPATSASLHNPNGVAVDGGGNVLIADSGNNRVRQVAAGTGVVTTVAGSSDKGFSGDGGPGTSASLSPLYGVAVDASGNVLIADSGNRRVRRLMFASATGTPSPSGSVTVADGTATLLPAPITASSSAGTPSVAGSGSPSGSPAGAGTRSAAGSGSGSQTGAPPASPPATASPCVVGASAATAATHCGHARAACGFSNATFWLASPVGGAPYRAYCAGDGWVLALRVNGAAGTFAYESPLWTSAALLNDAALDPAGAQEAKLAPYVDTPGSALRVEMTAPNGLRGEPLVLPIPGGFSSLRALLAGGGVATAAPLGAWYSLVPGGATYQRGCNAQGVNVAAPRMSFRIGIVWNEEENGCGTPDTALGLGGSISADWSWSWTSGQFVGCCYQDMSGSVYGGTTPGWFNVYIAGPVLSLTPSPPGSPTATPSPSVTGSGTASATAAATRSSSVSGSGSATTTATASASSASASATASASSASATPTGSASSTSTDSPTSSASGARVATPGRSASLTAAAASVAATATASAAATATAVISEAPRSSFTASPSVSSAAVNNNNNASAMHLAAAASATAQPAMAPALAGAAAVAVCAAAAACAAYRRRRTRGHGSGGVSARGMADATLAGAEAGAHAVQWHENASLSAPKRAASPVLPLPARAAAVSTAAATESPLLRLYAQHAVSMRRVAPAGGAHARAARASFAPQAAPHFASSRALQRAASPAVEGAAGATPGSWRQLGRQATTGVLAAPSPSTRNLLAPLGGAGGSGRHLLAVGPGSGGGSSGRGGALLQPVAMQAAARGAGGSSSAVSRRRLQLLGSEE